MKTVSFQLPEQLEESLKAIAISRGMGMSEFLREVVTTRIDKDRFGQGQEIDLSYFWQRTDLQQMANNPIVGFNRYTILLLLGLERINNSM
jgi:predicted DNA-binding protein